VVTFLSVNGLHGKDLENTFGCGDELPSHFEKELLAGGKGDLFVSGIGGTRRQKKGKQSEEYCENRVHEIMQARNDERLITKTRKGESTKREK